MRKILGYSILIGILAVIYLSFAPHIGWIEALAPFIGTGLIVFLVFIAVHLINE